MCRILFAALTGIALLASTVAPLCVLVPRARPAANLAEGVWSGLVVGTNATNPTPAHRNASTGRDIATHIRLQPIRSDRPITPSAAKRRGQLAGCKQAFLAPCRSARRVERWLFGQASVISGSANPVGNRCDLESEQSARHQGPADWIGPVTLTPRCAIRGAMKRRALPSPFEDAERPSSQTAEPREPLNALCVMPFPPFFFSSS